jgi:hypothetical protein
MQLDLFKSGAIGGTTLLDKPPGFSCGFARFGQENVLRREK